MQEKIYPTCYSVFLHMEKTPPSMKDLKIRSTKSMDLTTSLQIVQWLKEYANTTISSRPAKFKRGELQRMDISPSFCNN
jgi:hypothetical protein